MLWLAVSVRYQTAITPCVFKLASGLPCPACGTTRSIIALWHGDWRASWRINPLGFPALAGLALVPVWLVADLARGSDTLIRAFRRCELGLQRRPWLLVLLLVTIALNWAWNIIKGL